MDDHAVEDGCKMTGTQVAPDFRVFVSYRHEDEAGWATKLNEDLVDRFGPEAVFRDNEDISAGGDFGKHINDFLSSASAVVVVIGKRWQGKRDWSLRTRIWQDTDWVRKEVEFAGQSIPWIFPILVGGATLPVADELPPTLAFLPKLQAFELRSDRWDDDLAAFLGELEDSLRSPREGLKTIVFRRNEAVGNQRRRRHGSNGPPIGDHDGFARGCSIWNNSPGIVSLRDIFVDQARIESSRRIDTRRLPRDRQRREDKGSRQPGFCRWI